ncbi:hypothetical protein Ndes2526B_g08681 [Nannochloris sp. 'desiccata']|nr:hypothetical protein NADE_001403 [Chlorella desiccata (nom. nud.)]
MAEAKGPSDFTGYWVLSKVEQLDEFLKALGFPWVVRKAAAKFGSSSCDVVSHTGTTVRVTSLNPKGSWTRTYDTEKSVEQLNAEGVKCKTTAWWEGNVLHSRMEGSPLGTCESWRYRRGDTLVVKTSVKRKDDEQEATCFWYFERMQALQRHVGGESSKTQLLKALAADHKRVQQATRKDNAYLQKVLLDWDRWSSPADEFIRVASPLPYAGAAGSRSSRQHGSQASSRLRSRASPAGSPSVGVSQNPSTNSLSGLVSNQDGGAGGRSSRLVAAGGGGREHAAASAPHHPLPSSRSAAALSALANAAPEAESPTIITTSPGSEGPSPGSHARKPSVESTGPSVTSTTSAVAAAATAAAVASVSRKPHHYRSPSADSVNMSQFTPSRGAAAGGGGGGGVSGLSNAAGQLPPTGPEALMVFKLHEFLDSRGIASVVPVTHPNDTNEPQLLGMSPEQAEETAAKLRELETDMLLRRQEHVSGWACCGLVLSRENDTLPDHLRVWEMTLA